MSAFEDFKKKWGLKKFHQRVDEFEEKIEKKLRECWTSVVNTISAKLEKKPVMKITNEKVEKVTKPEKKEKRKPQPQIRFKKVVKKTSVPPTSKKPPTKIVKPIKKAIHKPAPKSFNKTISKPMTSSALKSQEIVPKQEKEVKENNDIKVFKSHPSSFVSNSSKKRGRPKKDEDAVKFKTSIVSKVSVKKSKNTKSIKKSKPK